MVNVPHLVSRGGHPAPAQGLEVIHKQAQQPPSRHFLLPAWVSPFNSPATIFRRSKARYSKMSSTFYVIVTKFVNDSNQLGQKYYQVVATLKSFPEYPSH